MRMLALLLSSAACAVGHAPPSGDPDARGLVDARRAPDAARVDEDGAVPDAGGDLGPDAALHPPATMTPLTGSFGGLGAYLHVPPGMPVGEPRPLIVVLHGCWENATVHAANAAWNTLAEARRWYVLYAEEAGQIQQCFDWWSAIAQGGGGDAAAVIAMIDAVAATYDVDPDGVVVAGFSSGAGLAVILLATHPERFAGGIIAAGLPYRGYTGSDVGTLSYIFSEHDAAPASRAAAMPGDGPYPPIVALVGSADATVHPTYTRELVEQWTAVHGADAIADSEGRLKPDHAGHVYRQYRDPDGRLLIATVTLDGMAHGYAVDPGGAGPDAGGSSAATLPGKPSYGRDVGLWGSYWAAEALGLD